MSTRSRAATIAEHRRRMAEKQKPVELPAEDEMHRAWNAVDQWRLHWYQLLYFHDPRWTEPGPRGPFLLRNDEQHSHCLRVECNLRDPDEAWNAPRHEEYDFVIGPGTTDEEVLNNCQLVADAVWAKKPPVHMACCPLAEAKGCVCAYAFTCPLHGERHIGTHD